MIQANDPNTRFSPDHTYVKVEDGEALIGLTYFGQDHTSRVSQVEFPSVGQKLARGQPFATIEAIKATVELPMPVTGEVLAINEALKAEPWLINTDPYGQGWIIRVRLDDPTQLDQLMDETTYQASAVWEPEQPW
jgi:glycine cleavage system H protein